MLCVVAEKASFAGAAPVVGDALAQLIEEDVHVLVAAPDRRDHRNLFPQTTYLSELPDNRSAEATRFLDYWKPDILLVLGSAKVAKIVELAKLRDITVIYASPERVQHAQRFPAHLKWVDTCLAASASEAQAMRNQFPSKLAQIETAGPLTDTVIAPACDDAECDTLAQLLGGRPVWLAASVGQVEVEMMEKAHRRAFRFAHRLLLILVPADAKEATGIVEVLEAKGWRTGLRSKGDLPDGETQIYVADTPEDMGLWYRLSPSTFVGGTFMPTMVPADPYTPAALGSAVLHGPHTGPTPDRFERLDAQGASVMVQSVEELGEAVTVLLAPDKAASLAQAGWATTTESAQVVERLAELMVDALDAREARV